MPQNDHHIDSHKLHMHPQRVAAWLNGENISPIYVEICPTGSCNHRCRFCSLDFMGYQSRHLPSDILMERLVEMGQAGVKSVMFAGEGEPLLHPEISRIALGAKGAGIDVAFTTNGVLLSPDIAERILPVTSWIKISCNAGTADTYGYIHGTKPGDFEKVLSNIEHAANIRQKQRSSCSLGVQMLLLPENQHEARELAGRAKLLGADYFVIKPFTLNPQSGKTEYAAVSYDNTSLLAEELAQLNDASFSVIFRHEAIGRWQDRSKPYSKCLALPFWSYIDSGGTMWGCFDFLGDSNFSHGNILKESFVEILNGSQRLNSLKWCESNLNASLCRPNCRLDPANRYLWELKHPEAHVNFI